MLRLDSAGAVLLHSAVHSEVGSSSFTCQCSGQPLQPAQASRRPLTQQHIGSSLRSVAREVAVHASPGSKQQTHAFDFATSDWQRQDLQGISG